MANRIVGADSDTLLRQASATAADYLKNAIEEIDDRLGEGYAARNPSLIAAFMEVAASDFNAALAGKVMEDGLEKIADSLSEIAQKID